MSTKKKSTTTRKSTKPATTRTTRTAPLEEVASPNLSRLRYEMGKQFAEKIVLRCEYDEDYIKDLIVFCDIIAQDCHNGDPRLAYEMAESAIKQAYSMSALVNVACEEYRRQVHDQQGTK